jgi:hypothetical protein
MAGARLKEAFSDLAETIRRVFQPPPSHPVPVGWKLPFPGQVPALAATVAQPFEPCQATARAQELLGQAVAIPEALGFAAKVTAEPGWAAWETGAKVCALPLFRPERCARLEVPPLPRRVAARQAKTGDLATRSRSGWAAFAPPGVRRAQDGFAAPRSCRGLERVLALPVAVAGEDMAKVSKALWMRYTLQLVRATGENIRGLDVIGLYRIPAKGTRQLNQDPATGKLLVTLGPEASGARRSLFILARRKSDASTVYCFLEEP